MIRRQWQFSAMPQSDNLFSLEPKRRTADTFTCEGDWGRCSGRLLYRDEATSEQTTYLDDLSSSSPFIEPLSKVYATDLTLFTSTLMLIERLYVGASFLNDPRHRLGALKQLCHGVLSFPAIVLIDPAAAQLQPITERARFLLPDPHHLELAICLQFGSIGFAQLCGCQSSGNMQPARTPLLINPYDPERSLLAPVSLPTKQFSQSLLVRRVSADHLILFDKLSLKGRIG